MRGGFLNNEGFDQGGKELFARVESDRKEQGSLRNGLTECVISPEWWGTGGLSGIWKSTRGHNKWRPLEPPLQKKIDFE